MSGHSKWSTIRHQKASEDAKRGAVFTKVSKKIHIAVKKGGSGDPNTNPYLRTVLDEAKAVNMPNDNIKRAVDKALGSGGSDASHEVTYEAYGPGGVGILITAVTDNRNRTAAEINTALNRYEAKLGGPGSVSYMRNLAPTPTVSLPPENKTQVEQLLSVLGNNDDVVDVWTNLAE